MTTEARLCAACNLPRNHHSKSRVGYAQHKFVKETHATARMEKDPTRRTKGVPELHP